MWLPVHDLKERERFDVGFGTQSVEGRSDLLRFLERVARFQHVSDLPDLLNFHEDRSAPAVDGAHRRFHAGAKPYNLSAALVAGAVRTVEGDVVLDEKPFQLLELSP